MINRELFFASWRENIKGYKLGRVRVDGINQFLGFLETDPKMTTVQNQAYILATCAHETGWTFKPIREKRQVKTDTAQRRKIKGLQDRYWGSGYYGRGYVQITWEDNYVKLASELGVDLANNPEWALVPQTAYDIMSIGMREGLFTGKKLNDYIDNNKTDYVSARRIVNGKDKACEIAQYAEKFEKILKDSVSDRQHMVKEALKEDAGMGVTLNDLEERVCKLEQARKDVLVVLKEWLTL